MSLRSGAATARAFARAAAVQVEEPAILTCAVSGGAATGNPSQPIDRDEVIAQAVAAAHAGASVVHIHARGADGGMTDAADDYLAIKHAVRQQADDVVLNFSTGASLADGAQDDRGQALVAAPELATLNCGSMNLGAGEDVLMNPRSLIDQLAEEMRRRQIVPEYECFDLGMVLTAASLAGARPVESPGMIHMVLGLAGGAPADPATVALFAQLVPPGVPWALTAIRRHFPLMGVTLALGGHIRTGLEDVAQLAPGVYAESNAQLVRRAKDLCEGVGRAVATPAQARQILGIGAPCASS